MNPFPDIAARHPRAPALARALAVVLALAAGPVGARAQALPTPPRPEVPGLAATLFADPSWTTAPVGIAVGPDDRLHVVESLSRPGPGTGTGQDRIVILPDTDRDGVADGHPVFAGGFTGAVSLAILPGGDRILVCAREIWRLGDGDRDGVADRREQLAVLETSNLDPHSGLLGIAVDPRGDLVVSRGHNQGLPWRLRARDGSSVSGYGDGGDILRLGADGSGLRRIASGLWNAAGIAFDRDGRLLAADNDPDATGPNRLVHVVTGGDYGARTLHGDAGTHPLQGWSGGLPGTLPFAVGLGEAPAGLVAARRTAAAGYGGGDLLVALWGAHRVDRVVLRAEGASVSGTTIPLLHGSPDFRPTSLAVDSQGTLYVADWVRMDYAERGPGRIWAIRRTDPIKADPASPGRRDRRAARAARELERLDAGGPVPARRLRSALRSGDPFREHAARRALSDPGLRAVGERFRRDADPRVRAAAVLADGGPEAIRLGLSDPDPEVRRAALAASAGRSDPAMLPDLDRVFAAGPVDAELFAMAVAASEVLHPEFVAALRARGEVRAGELPRNPDPLLLDRVFNDPAQPPEVRAAALSIRVRERPAGHLALLIAALSDPALPVAVAAAGALATASDPAADAALRDIALDRSRPAELRTEALVSLGGRHDPGVERLLPLLGDADPEVRHEAARLLRSHVDHPAHPGVRTAFGRSVAADPAAASDDVFQAALGTLPVPVEEGDWMAVAGAGGDPARGRRVFLSAQAGCASCHAVGTRGGETGPALTRIGRSLDRAALVRAILRPSDEFAPRYQGWFVETTEGSTVQGTGLERHSDGSLTLRVAGAGWRTFGGADVAGHGALPASLMPDGLAGVLTPGEFRDLVAYLEALR